MLPMTGVTPGTIFSASPGLTGRSPLAAVSAGGAGPTRTPAEDQAHDRTARALSERFENDLKQVGPYVSDAVKAAAIHAVT